MFWEIKNTLVYLKNSHSSFPKSLQTAIGLEEEEIHMFTPVAFVTQIHIYR